MKKGLGAVHKGRPQRRGGGYGQMRTLADRGVKNLADVRKMALFLALFQHALQTLPMGDGY